jgi:hypothetical protein
MYERMKRVEDEGRKSIKRKKRIDKETVLNQASRTRAQFR